MGKTYVNLPNIFSSSHISALALMGQFSQGEHLGGWKCHSTEARKPFFLTTSGCCYIIVKVDSCWKMQEYKNKVQFIGVSKLLMAAP